MDNLMSLIYSTTPKGFASKRIRAVLFHREWSCAFGKERVDAHDWWPYIKTTDKVHTKYLNKFLKLDHKSCTCCISLCCLNNYFLCWNSNLEAFAKNKRKSQGFPLEFLSCGYISYPSWNCHLIINKITFDVWCRS